MLESCRVKYRVKFQVKRQNLELEFYINCVSIGGPADSGNGMAKDTWKYTLIITYMTYTSLLLKRNQRCVRIYLLHSQNFIYKQQKL